jgi:DNA-binding NtrC family response regulator
MTPPAPRILVVDDEEKIRSIVSAILRDEGYDVRTAANGIEALNAAATCVPDLLLVDLQMPHMDGIETLSRFRERHPAALAIVLTAHGSIRSAVDAIKGGAYDYLTKPFDNEHLLLAVRRATELARVTAELDALKRTLDNRNSADAILGASAVMADLRDQIRRIARTDATVLIEGESGTGKELTARAIHGESARRGKPFRVVDCTSIPHQLFESSLFGHEKGAFTDAHERSVGSFEEAEGGTVFLDEIGELPHEAQAKLLRVLQEKEFTRVGGTAPVRVDVRIIAATNRPMEAAVRAGQFREDLYYRLHVLALRVPPLREHAEDIPLYVHAFVSKHRSTLASRVTGISDEALSVFAAQPWRGNIRELENAVQRALLSANSTTIETADVRVGGDGFVDPGMRQPGEEGLDGAVRAVVEQTERRMILETLRATGWNRTLAAQRLRVSRKTLFNKIQQYGIQEETGNSVP